MIWQTSTNSIDEMKTKPPKVIITDEFSHPLPIDQSKLKKFPLKLSKIK